MAQTFRSVMDDVYDYAATPIWSSDGTRLGRRYRIIAPSRPEYVYVPIRDNCGYTSLRADCRRFTDVEAFRREVARLYIAGVGSPAPDNVTAFPDATITADEERALLAAAQAARDELSDDSHSLTRTLEHIAVHPTRDVKTLLELLKDAAAAWEEYEQELPEEAGRSARYFPTSVIREELERRLWERSATSIVEIVEPSLPD